MEEKLWWRFEGNGRGVGLGFSSGGFWSAESAAMRVGVRRRDDNRSLRRRRLDEINMREKRWLEFERARERERGRMT